MNVHKFVDYRYRAWYARALRFGGAGRMSSSPSYVASVFPF